MSKNKTHALVDLEKFFELLDLGSFDGAHHKQWALDQIARLVYGDDYDNFVASYEGDDGDYTWDTGIAP